MQVEDPEGGVCTSNVLYSVGSPPTVTLYEPGSGTVHNLSSSIYFEAVVQDSEDPASLLQVEWISDIDGVFYSDVATSSGLSALNYSQLSVGNHNITVKVTDTDGLYDTAITNIRLNTLLHHSPIHPYLPGTRNILAQVSGSLMWTATPLPSSTIGYSTVSIGQTTAQLPSSATVKVKRDTRVTPNDGYTDGQFTDVSFTIGTQRPLYLPSRFHQIPPAQVIH